MIVYNVHGLIHLADDAKTFKSLENISAFPFENFLASLKNIIRKPEFPLAHIIRRLSEKATEIEKKVYLKLSKQHNNGPLTEGVVDGLQFHKIKTGKYILKKV